jgi:hypothetical protein
MNKSRHYWHWRRSARLTHAAHKAHTEKRYGGENYGLDRHRAALERAQRDRARLPRAGFWFAAWFAFCGLLGLALTAFGVWVVYVLVEFVITR